MSGQINFESMSDECRKSFQLCEDLQNLIIITLDYVILPLRKETKKCSEYSEILNLEIQDGENKTFEYIAQQISEINNVDEEVANEILKHYPKSDVCFRCLGLDEDTLHGFIWIRDLDFSHLFDMQREEVVDLLSTYRTSSEDIEHILTGLSKIRGNVELLENDLPLEDDTRNLIKLVIKLTERNGHTKDAAFYADEAIFDGLSLSSPPLLVTGPTDFMETLSIEHKNDNETSLQTTSPCVAGIPANNLSDSSRSAVVNCEINSPPISSTRSASISESHPASRFSTSSAFINGNNFANFDFATQTLNRNSRRSKTQVQFNRICRALSPLPYRVPSSIAINELSKVCAMDGGLSVPTTPATKFFSTPVHQKISVSPSKASGMSASLTNAIDCTPPHSPYSQTGFFPKSATTKDRDKAKYSKFPVTSPSKHKIKFPFPLHRSKSHESNLASRINMHHSKAFKIDNASPKSFGKARHATKSPANSICAETSVFCFPTPTHISHPPSSPNFYPISHVNTRSESHAPLSLLNENLMPGNSGYLAVPGISSQGGAIYAMSVSGQVHKFEPETNIGDMVRGPSCCVCNFRIVFRSQHCAYCNLKTHRQCVANAYRLPCERSARFSDSSDGQRRLATCVGHIAPLCAASSAMGSDSNSASSCTSCSTPGSPFFLEPGTSLPSTATIACRNHQPPSYTCNVGANVSRNGLLAPVENGARGPVTLLSCANIVPAENTHSGSEVGNRTNDLQRMSTISSCESSRTVVEDRLSRLESLESQEDGPIFMRHNSLSVTLKDWNIPMSSLHLGDIIGRGTFGTVYRGKWHGEVAVKLIDFDPQDPDGRFSVDAFKREVVTLHKTRHENLVLFMGACMQLPNLAIVTQLSKGETLHYLLHFRRHALNTNRAIAIASQIAKGMGYLHARQIVHRDLKTRNIFIEVNYKAVIADFGLFNFVKFCKRAKSGSYVHVPPNWLSYVAPEIIRALNIDRTESDSASELPFTAESDIFAFGTVWYELLTCEYPYKGLPTETLVYLVGNGIKPPLQLPCPKDFKEIMVHCWAYHPHKRPEFTSLVRVLDRLPKLHRSPSYPTKTPSLVGPISRDTLLV